MVPTDCSTDPLSRLGVVGCGYAERKACVVRVCVCQQVSFCSVSLLRDIRAEADEAEASSNFRSTL